MSWGEKLCYSPYMMTDLMNQYQDILRFYTDMGIDAAVGEVPSNYFTYVAKKVAPPPSPDVKPVTKEVPKVKKSVTDTAHPALACKTLEELRQAMQDFEGCALKETATNTVFADGNPQAKVMVIGEAPGADEDRQGVPFVGLSGQLLDRIFATIGLSRQENIYITNIVPWRPPGNRQPTTQEIAACEPFVQKHIELINPDILILVGGVSAKTILKSNEGIMRLRGHWHDYETATGKRIKTIPTFHPAYLLRSPGQKAQVWKDMLLVKKTMHVA